jgi:hypothetical protein
VSEWLLAQGHTEAASWWVVIIGTTNDGFGALMLPSLIPVMMLGLMYPTGRFTSGPWRVYALTLGVILLVGGIAAFITEPAIGGEALRHPVLGDSASRGALDVQYTLFFAASVQFLFSLTSLVGRFKRSGVVVRQQIKLFGFGVAIYGIFNIASIFLTEAGGGTGAAISEQTAILLDSIVFAVIPISLGFAVFRHRLFDVDRLISRTVGYALVLSTVAIVFAVLVTIPSVMLSSGEVASWEIALATLAAAAIFSPIRRRLQRVVDRRFDRARFDAVEVTESLGAQMQDTVDIGEARRHTAAAIDRIVRPSSIGIWLRDDPVEQS